MFCKMLFKISASSYKVLSSESAKVKLESTNDKLSPKSKLLSYTSR